jgi:hypothetical protein
MSESENKAELEPAAQALGLSSSASLEEIEEAYQDLQVILSPARFAGNDRLKRRAEVQLRRVGEAYRRLKASHAPHDPMMDVWSMRGGKQPRPSHVARAPHADGSPSILDDVFAEEAAKPARRFPIWLVVAAVLLAVLLGVLFVPGNGGWSSNSDLGLEPPAPPPEQTPPPTPSDLKVPQQPEPAVSGKDVTPVQPPSTAPAATQPRSDAGVSARQDRQVVPSSPPTSAAAVPGSKSGDKPQLVRDEGNAIAKKEVRAFDILRQKSDAARRLIDGQVSGLRFVDWQTRALQGNEFLVDLLAEQSATGQQAHLVWSVDTQKETTRAMSQAARDLETSPRN